MELLGIFRLIYLLGSVNAGFFSCLIFSKRSKTIADKILGVWLIILSLQLLIPFLYLTNLNIYYKYAGIEIAFYAFHPVLLYLYVKTTIRIIPELKVILWNALVIVIAEVFGLSFLMYPAKERLLFIEGKEFLPLIYIPLVILMMGYFAYNIYASYKSLKDYKNKILQVYSYRESVDLLWLRRLTILFGTISLIVFPLGLVSYYGFHSMVFADYFFFVTLAVFIFFLGYWGYQQGQVFSFNNGTELPIVKDDEKISVLPVEYNKLFKEKAIELEKLMQLSKPFLNPKLTIHDLSKEMSLPPHQLSKIINKEFHCNFYEFVNKFRVEEFKQQSFSSANKNLTILAIAFDCGFNSKSAFNRIFKEYSGIAPSDFIKNHKL